MVFVLTIFTIVYLELDVCVAVELWFHLKDTTTAVEIWHFVVDCRSCKASLIINCRKWWALSWILIKYLTALVYERIATCIQNSVYGTKSWAVMIKFGSKAWASPVEIAKSRSHLLQFDTYIRLLTKILLLLSHKSSLCAYFGTPSSFNYAFYVILYLSNEILILLPRLKLFEFWVAQSFQFILNCFPLSRSEFCVLWNLVLVKENMASSNPMQYFS